MPTFAIFRFWLEKLILFKLFLMIFRPFLQPFHPLGALPLLSGRKKGIARQIVGHVAKADFGSNADDANCSHHGAPSSHRHDAKYMFYPAANSRPAAVTLLLSVRKLFIPTAPLR